MTYLKVDTIAGPGQPLSQDAGVPELFVDFLNKQWRKGIILGISLPDQEEQGVDQEKWGNVGNRLVEDLLELGQFVGLSLDGQCPVDAVLSWTKSAVATHQLGIVALEWTSSPHPTGRPANAENVRWSVIQAIGDTAWMKSLWVDTASELFHYGCDLILAVYDTEEMLGVQGDHPLTVETFGLTLSRAVGWLVPLEVGFIIGVPVESKLYRQLTSKAVDGIGR